MSILFFPENSIQKGLAGWLIGLIYLITADSTELHSNGYRGGKEEVTLHASGRQQAYSTISRGAYDDADKDSRRKVTWYDNSLWIVGCNDSSISQ